MSAFEDASPMSEKRWGEAERQRKKKIMLALSTSALLVLAVVGTLAVISYESGEAPAPSEGTKLHAASKYVQELCASTDYRNTCESTLSKAVKNDTRDPKVLLKATIDVAFDEVTKAFEHSSLLKSNDSRIRGAMEDCVDLYLNSKDELKRTLESIVDGGIENLPKRSGDVQSWLSAVMTFQQTCIDGFPEGELKTKLNGAMKKGKEVTSNALAIITEASNFLSLIDVMPTEYHRRRLLAKEESIEASLKKDGFPSWIDDADRRLLREHHRIKPKLEPNVTVSKDGHGDYTTISEALAAMPEEYEGRYVIYVKKGIYEETVNVTKHMPNVTMYGEGAKKTIVTGNRNVIDGYRTVQTASFVAYGHGFVAIGMGFRNTAGPAKHQAVALRVLSDRSMFINCRMEGYQDTLYAHAQRQLYRSCIIVGTIDFVFGDATAVFQNCLFVVLRPLDNQQNIITAQGRIDPHETTGFVLHRCRIQADSHLADKALHPIPSYLARPWKQYSRTIIMETEIGNHIEPEGYMPWNDTFALDTLYYAEYNNFGPGANLTGRVSWPGVHVIEREEADSYTVKNFLDGGRWIPAIGVAVPVQMGLYDLKLDGLKLKQD